ncbi:MAG: antibiotic biosynthesis monooxygenase [Bdellovibrionota bacterium]
MDQDRNVSFIVNHKVKPDFIPRYEEWLKKIVKRAAEYPGHQGVHIIRPPAGGNDYAAIIRWETIEHAKTWAESSHRKELLSEISNALVEPDNAKITPGIEYWFTYPGQIQRKAPGWKQWLVTTSVIWPLSLGIPKMLAPLFREFPTLEFWPLRSLIVVAVVVATATYFIMPYYVRAISKWMFKAQ